MKGAAAPNCAALGPACEHPCPIPHQPQFASEPSRSMNLDESFIVNAVIVFAIARADSSGASGALGPPISVRTQPGVSATTQMFLARSSAAIVRVTMFNAAFDAE